MGKYPGIKMASGALRRILDSDEQGRLEGGQLGHFALGPTLLIRPKRSIYSNRTVKYSIKAVTTYILPWAPQALSAALVTRMESRMITAIASISVMNLLRETKIYERRITHHVDTENADSVASSSVTEFESTERRSSSSLLSVLKALKSSDLARKIKC